MGIETAALVMAGVAGAAEIGKAGTEAAAAKAQEHALDLEAKQMQLQTQQKTLSNYDVMEKVLDAQIAHQTITGTAMSSPSFNAIQRSTLNTGAKNQRNIDIEGDLAQENIKQEKRNVRNSLYAQLFGDVADFAFFGSEFANAMPKEK